MKILTIGETPYLLTRNARINRDLILSLQKQGHECHSLVYAHDISYFLSTETGDHFFDHNGERTGELHPFFGEQGSMPQFALNIMKRVQPQVVITIGEYHESTQIWPVKATYPHLFKWVAIVPEGTATINEHFKEQLEYADVIITTSNTAAQQLRALVGCPVEMIPYGPDVAAFQPLGLLPDDFGVMTVGRNIQMSNLPAFIRGVSQAEGIEGYIHTNMDDVGDNDLRLLLRRYKCEEKIGLSTQKFISIREGVSEVFLNELYNRYHAFVSCSMQSATALTMLEAMATGCVPIGMDFGRVGEILQQMPLEYRIIIPHNVFVGPRGEEYAIVAEKALSAALNGMRKQYETSKEWFAEGRREASRIANLFSKDVFIERLNSIVEGSIICEHTIVVDSLTGRS